jgi:hypothetical protein
MLDPLSFSFLVAPRSATYTPEMCVWHALGFCTKHADTVMEAVVGEPKDAAEILLLKTLRDQRLDVTLYVLQSGVLTNDHTLHRDMLFALLQNQLPVEQQANVAGLAKFLMSDFLPEDLAKAVTIAVGRRSAPVCIAAYQLHPSCCMPVLVEHADAQFFGSLLAQDPQMATAATLSLCGRFDRRDIATELLQVDTVDPSDAVRHAMDSDKLGVAEMLLQQYAGSLDSATLEWVLRSACHKLTPESLKVVVPAAVESGVSLADALCTTKASAQVVFSIVAACDDESLAPTVIDAACAHESNNNIKTGLVVAVRARRLDMVNYIVARFQPDQKARLLALGLALDAGYIEIADALFHDDMDVSRLTNSSLERNNVDILTFLVRRKPESYARAVLTRLCARPVAVRVFKKSRRKVAVPVKQQVSAEPPAATETPGVAAPYEQAGIAPECELHKRRRT